MFVCVCLCVCACVCACVRVRVSRPPAFVHSLATVVMLVPPARSLATAVCYCVILLAAACVTEYSRISSHTVCIIMQLRVSPAISLRSVLSCSGLGFGGGALIVPTNMVRWQTHGHVIQRLG